MILVTGHRGFIGSNLYTELSDLGFKVAGLDREYLERVDWRKYLTDFLEDLSPSFVFHVGACSDTLEEDVNLVMLWNWESSKVISDWCYRTGTGIVYSSSAAGYGRNGLNPVNLYGWSKKISEDWICRSGGISLRYFNVFGPGEYQKGKMASVAYQSWVKHKKGEEVLLFPGKPQRDFIYVRDVISANIWCMKNYNQLKGKPYDVGLGESYPFEYVLESMGVPFRYTTEDKIPGGYQFLTRANPNLFPIGWKPTWKLFDALCEYRDLLENNLG